MQNLAILAAKKLDPFTEWIFSKNISKNLYLKNKTTKHTAYDLKKVFISLNISMTSLQLHVHALAQNNQRKVHNLKIISDMLFGSTMMA